MNLVRISAVFAFGVLAACGGVPDETRVASYGDGTRPALSEPAQSEPAQSEPAQSLSAKTTAAPAQESASAAIAEARAAATAASAAPKEEKPAPGALAFSPVPDDDPKAPAQGVTADDENAKIAALPQIAALPKQAAEPAVGGTEPPAEAALRPSVQPPVQPSAQPRVQPYRVQLAAYREPSGAEAAWERLLRAYPDLLTGQSRTVRRADLGATRGVVHQLRVGPFSGEAKALAFCETLKKRGADCFVVVARSQAREGGQD